MSEIVHTGAVIVGPAGRLFAGAGDVRTIYPAIDRARTVAAAWNASPAFREVGPLMARRCTVILETDDD